MGAFIWDGQRAFLDLDHRTSSFCPVLDTSDQSSPKKVTPLLSQPVFKLRPSEFFHNLRNVLTSLLMSKCPGVYFEGEAGKIEK
jgi:hypothetical protein